MMEIGGYIIYLQALLMDLQLTSTKCFQLKGFRFLHDNDLLQLLDTSNLDISKETHEPYQYHGVSPKRIHVSFDL